MDVKLDFNAREFIEAVEEQRAFIKTVRSYPDPMAEGLILYDLCNLPKEAELPTLKLICTFETEEEAKRFRDYARALPYLKNNYISRSWSVGVEINAAHATKGHAVQFIKKCLGNIHTAIGIGDYENDVKLLEMADIGVAVGDSLQCVKDVADWVVKPHAECAVRDLIQRLEERIDKGIAPTSFAE